MRLHNQRIPWAWANLLLCLVGLVVQLSAQRPTDPAPTPGASVTFSAQAGLHDAAFTLQLGVVGAEGATLRYTTDGSVPSPTTGTAYAGPWQVTNALILTNGTSSATVP